ncbi:hypothetical protein [Agrobacterium rubi]|uniref:Uncharacterized protein n=1 Tax=Agrobacterium rubi TaxID=28099 RepID=A0AAE7UQI9_9HYPH|nr:hypothetical protein [Agrobacterium rubi]NTE89014.1 hypothetical protein [Agrobacterium rubi]NTF04842.1 hypothetical protein [Agrobacterium rubi]NTF39403.1 hypothetical protein [Agrobacterium rubi]OCJ51116.1 hypothetical protein A6U92_05630 [Agrobacterium rubi]QTG03038.1 hypothetical protein G6M88_22015 [Agrobacterium rubi]
MTVRVAKVNGILHKDADLFNTLQRSVRLLSAAIPDREIDAYDGYFGVTGSATIVRHGGRHYAICTRHQVELRRGGPPPASLLESLVVTSEREENPLTGRNKMGHIPFDRCHYDNEAGAEEYSDLLILEALETYKGIAFDQPSHLRRYIYSENLPMVDGLSVGAVFSFRKLRGATHTFLDAIMVRGGNGYLYGVSSGYLIGMLQRLPQR